MSGFSGRRWFCRRILVYLKLANSWIIFNVGGGPTPDKPEVILETPRDLNRQVAF